MSIDPALFPLIGCVSMVALYVIGRLYIACRNGE